ncbi:MAG: SapC family protein [Pseudomonadota bacterium]
MAELIELSNKTHSDLRLVENCALMEAKNQHVIGLKVSEVGMAAGSFPLFFTKNTQTGDWAISAVAGLELNTNLFIENDYWDATYLPTVMQTYPFYLMKSEREEGSYTIGIDEENTAFSKTEGKPLFEDSGKASIMLSGITTMLEEDIKNQIQTFQYAKELDELGLIKGMNVLVHYNDGNTNTLKGLYTPDEEKLQALSVEDLDALRQKGYLPAIYAMLISIYQLNAMILRNNRLDGTRKIKQVQLEATKAKASW